MPQQDDRAALIDSMRALLDLLSEQPAIPVHEYSMRIDHCVLEAEDGRGIATVERAAQCLGVEVRRERHVMAEKRVGAATYRIYYVPHAHMRRYEAEQSYREVIQIDDEVG